MLVLLECLLTAVLNVVSERSIRVYDCCCNACAVVDELKPTRYCSRAKMPKADVHSVLDVSQKVVVSRSQTTTCTYYTPLDRDLDHT